MIDVDVLGASRAPDAPSKQEIERLCERAAASRRVSAGHVAIEFVDEARIAQLNAAYRGKAAATDVLSFPIDGIEPLAGGDPCGGSHAAPPPRELGDVVICPQRTADLREAIVHGMLHLLGMDHETDDGEMLALQRRLLAGAGR
jgi:probable rRNA maturation factor